MDKWEEKRRWHLGKEIPISVLLVLVIQTVGIVWWARGLTSEVATSSAAISDLRVDMKALNSTVVAQTLPIINAAKIVALERELSALTEELKVVRAEQLAHFREFREMQHGRR